MFVVEASALIPHPPETVFAAAASVEGIVRWQSGVCGVRLPPGRALRTGPLHVLYRALGVQYVLEAHVTAFEPSHRFAYRAVCPAFTLEATLTLQAASAGARVRYHLALHIESPPSADATRVTAADATALRRLLVRRASGDLARLAEWVAERAPSAPSEPTPAPMWDHA